MRKLGIGLFVFVLWLSLSAFAQDAGGQQPSDQQPSASQGQTSPSDQGSASQGQTPPSDQESMAQESTSGKKMGKAVHLRGKISDDGKTFTSDKDNSSWTIVNPDAVKGHEGHDVVLRAHVDKANNSIHVMSLKMAGQHGSKKKASSSGSMSEQPPQ